VQQLSFFHLSLFFFLHLNFFFFFSAAKREEHGADWRRRSKGGLGTARQQRAASQHDVASRVGAARGAAKTTERPVWERWVDVGKSLRAAAKG
jgi:hypothetical protein